MVTVTSAQQKQRIRIVLKAFDHRLLDQSAEHIVAPAERAGRSRTGGAAGLGSPSRARSASPRRSATRSAVFPDSAAHRRGAAAGV